MKNSLQELVRRTRGRDTGGTGTDTLYGGAGGDTYIYTSGDGSDTIYDNAGDGKGGDQEGKVEKATAGGTFKSDDKQYTYSWGGAGNDALDASGGSNLLLGEAANDEVFEGRRVG